MNASTVVQMAQAMIDSSPGKTVGDVASYLLGVNETEARILVQTVVKAGDSACKEDPNRVDPERDALLMYTATIGLIFGMAAESCQMAPKKLAA